MHSHNLPVSRRVSAGKLFGNMIKGKSKPPPKSPTLPLYPPTFSDERPAGMAGRDMKSPKGGTALIRNGGAGANPPSSMFVMFCSRSSRPPSHAFHAPFQWWTRPTGAPTDKGPPSIGAYTWHTHTREILAGFCLIRWSSRKR